MPEAALRTADFDYPLPPQLIAQAPAPVRDQSRLLVLDRFSQTFAHAQFPDLLNHLRRGDLLVLNDSRVIPARLRGQNPRTDGHFEILLIEDNAANDWWALLRPARRARVGTVIKILTANQRPSGITAEVTEFAEGGRRRLRFAGTDNIMRELGALGETPLPPYIDRLAPAPGDRERYQTVYARPPGSVAAPTAGLHFTPELLTRIAGQGVKVCFVTLHVGLGTFAPVKVETVADHVMHAERFEIGEETARLIGETKAGGGRVVAVGTTTLRVLEAVARQNAGQVIEGRGSTNLFLYPPSEFYVANALLTNFHLPMSTLLMLVSAFASPGRTHGRELVLAAYAEAVRARYRFFSYGDAMLLV